ncbi:iron chelate uptake ABC transporter family permease subunit [Spiribacter sp. 2438]|uniref:FecCD family ABC transporter permease n=1 Tax=Spiribacter sp. 2438 TaxID=2666185 RepID=UPI0012AF978B|nr:iron ABC transporter permease [Spiribacter sp. 2438]QGM20994.1 iron chelate uptake ABC transporter family permease subunit [Spiribacter sp. 2438]
MRVALWLSPLVLGLFLASLVIGPAAIGPGESLVALVGEPGTPLALVMQEIRLPRALLAVLVGGSLGLAGAALQGYLRNPLAEPGLLGISGSAALGAVLAIQTGLASIMPLGLPLAALTGALVGVVLISLLAGTRGGSLSLILAGIAISALASALVSLVLNLSPSPFATSEIVFWMMGSLADRSMEHVWLALPFIVVGMTMLLALGRPLDALTLGEDAAEALGQRLLRVRVLLILGAALVVGASTAVAGTIGFVGLVVPHVLRPLVGAMPGRLLPASALGGAAMVLLADSLVRVILPEADLKLGVVTAIIGAPLFLHLIYQTRRELE